MKKRYLFIYGQLNAGGAERVLLDLLHNFDYDRCEVDLLQVVAGGTLIDEIPTQVHVLQAWENYSMSYKLALHAALKLRFAALWRRRMMCTLNGKKYDVAISFLEGMPLKAHSLITDVAIRNYSWVHCDLNRDRYERHMFCNEVDEISAYNRMTAVICVSGSAKEDFLLRFQNTLARVEVIYNPVDMKKVQECSRQKLLQKEGFTIVVVGRLTEQKRVDRVIRLAAHLKNENKKVKIQVIGDGTLRDDLEKQAHELGVDDMVKFMGYIRNPYPYIKAADMLLSTSMYEGFSLVVGEAMALGTPVVATKTTGPTEILDASNYGLLCDHDDESIHQAVVSMIDSLEMREKYSSKGLERIAFFDVASAVERVIKL